MADVSITAANVADVSGGNIVSDFTAGATLAEGDVVYLDANSQWQKARATTATLAGENARTGIVLTPATSGRRVFVKEKGILNVGGTLTVGTVYGVSATLGKIAPLADLVTTNKITILGIAVTAANLDLAYKGAYLPGGYTGLAVP